MKLPNHLLLVPPVCLFPALTAWLLHQHAENFLLGLSSQFWAGVSIGCSIVFGAAFTALLVAYLYSARELENDRPSA
jgi:hypothetical protein